MKVEYLNRDDINSFIELINEVFGYKTTFDSVMKIINKNKILVIKDQDKVIASLTLEKRFEYVKNQYYYHLSYLCVSKNYRRMGYASMLFDKVEELVSKNNISYIELTSGNQRIGAHYFYQSKDFKIKDTTVFVKLYE